MAMANRRLPTNAPEPEPGDFDEELAQVASGHVHRRPGNPAARLSLRLTVEGESAEKLRRLARDRGQRPSEVVADLVRSA